jgi:hypothetical protein
MECAFILPYLEYVAIATTAIPLNAIEEEKA